MANIILTDLQVIFFFIYFVIKNFEKVFICHHAVGYIIIYCNTIISNTLDKMASIIELKIV